MKKYIISGVLLIISIFFVIIVQINAPKKINWAVSFSKKHTIPYGSYIVHKILSNIFPKKNIKNIETSLYDFAKTINKNKTFNLIIINRMVNFDTYDNNTLLELVKKGCNVFISAEYFAGKFADTFKIKTDYGFSLKNFAIQLANKKITRKKFFYDRNDASVYFSSVNKNKNITVLGFNERNEANFIKLVYGKGNIFLHSVPFAFSNYHILKKKNWHYASFALSYLPVKETYWDEYYKSLRQISRTPLRFILSKKALRYAYYLLLANIILFIVFHGKRLQRIIPIFNPHENTTLQFTSTIGRLYYEQRDHKSIATKLINYFLHLMKSKLYIDLYNIKEKEYEKIAKKCNVTEKDLTLLLRHINKIDHSDKINENDLIVLHDTIEVFKKKSGIQ